MPVRLSSSRTSASGFDGEDRLADGGGVRQGAATDLGEHPHEVLRWLDLGDVDDLFAVEHGEVDRLAERLDHPGHVRVRQRPQALRAGVGEPHQPRAERVLPGRLLPDVAEVDQRAHQAVDGGQRQVGGSVASWDSPITPPASAIASRIAKARSSDWTPPGRARPFGRAIVSVGTASNGNLIPYRGSYLAKSGRDHGK